MGRNLFEKILGAHLIAGELKAGAEIEIRVEVDEKVFSDVTSVLERLRQRIHDELRSELGISAHIHLAEPRSIPRSEGKAQRIIDKRSL